MNYSGVYSGGIRPRLRRPSLRQSVSGGGGAPETSFDNWEDWRASMVSAGGLSTSPSAWARAFNGPPFAFYETSAYGVTAAWGGGSHMTLDLQRPAWVSGLRIYVGNNASWGSAGARSQKAKLQGKNDAGVWEDIATNIELVDGGFVGNGSSGAPYLEEGDIQDLTVTDGSSSPQNGNWRRTYGWEPTRAYQEYRLFQTSKNYNGGYWYMTEITLRIEEF